MKNSPNNSGVIDAAKSAPTYADANAVWLRARSYLRVSAGTLAKVSRIVAKRFPFEFAAANKAG